MRRARLVSTGGCAAWAALLALACSDPPPAPARARGATRGASAPPAIEPSALPPAPGAVPSPSHVSPHRVPEPPAPAAPTALPSTPASDPDPSAPAATNDRLRDALVRAFGTPTHCVGEETRGRLRDTLVVQVQVSVTAAGRVTRASISSPQLAESDLECMRLHAERIRLDAQVPDAPRSVTASIEYRVTPATPPEPRRELPDVAPVPGRVAPDLTLPAAGTVRDRPPGTVPPSFTLEREGTVTTRPAGSVPPSFTLPAVAE